MKNNLTVKPLPQERNILARYVFKWSSKRGELDEIARGANAFFIL